MSDLYGWMQMYTRRLISKVIVRPVSSEMPVKSYSIPYRLGGLVLILLLLLIFNFKTAAAQQGQGDTGRYMVVTNTFTQYSWQLISRSSSQVLCLVNINHEGYPLLAEALAVCENALYPQAVQTSATQTPVPTNTPAPLSDVMDNTYWRFLEKREVTQTQKIPVPPIVINIVGNDTPTLKPFVTISAYEPFSDYKITAIKGDVGGTPFECQAASCDVLPGGDSTITYWAVSSFGDESPPYSATIRIIKADNNFKTTVTENENFGVYHDICANVWGNTPEFDNRNWSSFPQMPQEIATYHRLYHLAGELIRNDQVDASSCPYGGLFADGSPNSCGMEAAMPKVVEWQNHFDPAIWSAARDIGIPPVVLKSVIEQESQFWPASTRFVMYEYGLAQINEQGADVALRWDSALYDLICDNMMMVCKNLYASMSPASQAVLRGGLVSWLDADCPNCEFGISPQRAEQSMRMVAQVLRANCYQTSYLYQKYTTGASYEDSWKFTMVSYHGGYQCLADAIVSTLTQQQVLTWTNLSSHLGSCPDARDYVDNFWARLSSFQPNQSAVIQSRPVIEVRTPTPAPTPTLPPNPRARNGHVQVIVYMDYNNDYVLGDDELVDNIGVTVKYEDGSSETKTAVKGIATFVFSNQLKGSRVTIIIPQVYRNLEMTVPDDGNIFVLVRLIPPGLPGKLP
ncbi:MAG: hypothetical protein LWX83_06020 [Anaerolineae bacterium]|nr:hypothetical protein [Anaerolineae bacterium]